MARKQLVYGINDKPPLPILILAGAQHVLTLFGATTLVPLVLGPAMGMTTAQMGAFIGCVYFGMGIATLIQTHPKLGSGIGQQRRDRNPGPFAYQHTGDGPGFARVVER